MKRTFRILLACCLLLAMIPIAMASGEMGQAGYSPTISCGFNYSAAIKSDGTLWTWGYNGKSQLGDNSTENRFSPVKVLEDVVSVSAGDEVTAAITSDGVLWTWGCGNLGRGDAILSRTPEKLMDDVTAVSVYSGKGAAITSNGELWLWGRDSSGFTYKTPIKLLDSVTAV